MSKGQAHFTEYVFTIMFSVLVLMSVTALVYVFYKTSVKNEAQQSLKQIAVLTSDSIVKLYETSRNSKSQPTTYSSILISQIDLQYPSAVTKKNYEIFLATSNPVWTTVSDLTVGGQLVNTTVKTSGAKVIAQTTQDPVVSVEYDIPNVDVVVEGRSENGQYATLSYYRSNINGAVYDVIVLGKADILGVITNIS